MNRSTCWNRWRLCRSFTTPDIPPSDKVKKLDQMSPYFGYMMICYVDADITVYSDGSEPASLASRDYMQRLYSTGQRQVTDSFAAGADGVTLNYTVAVPLTDKPGQYHRLPVLCHLL